MVWYKNLGKKDIQVCTQVITETKHITQGKLYVHLFWGWLLARYFSSQLSSSDKNLSYLHLVSLQVHFND